jgi:hypothetical protein
VPGYEASDWFGLVAPKASTEIVDKLNKEINAGLADPKIKARLVEQGTVLAGSPTAFGSSSPTKPKVGQGGEVLRREANDQLVHRTVWRGAMKLPRRTFLHSGSRLSAARVLNVFPNQRRTQ